MKTSLLFFLAFFMLAFHQAQAQKTRVVMPSELNNVKRQKKKEKAEQEKIEAEQKIRKQEAKIQYEKREVEKEKGIAGFISFHTNSSENFLVTGPNFHLLYQKNGYTLDFGASYRTNGQDRIEGDVTNAFIGAPSSTWNTLTPQFDSRTYFVGTGRLFEMASNQAFYVKTEYFLRHNTAAHLKVTDWYTGSCDAGSTLWINNPEMWVHNFKLSGGYLLLWEKPHLYFDFFVGASLRFTRSVGDVYQKQSMYCYREPIQQVNYRGRWNSFTPTLQLGIKVGLFQYLER